MIKQWIANWLLKGVRVLEHDVTHSGKLPGYTVQGDGWWISVLGEPASVAPYVPKYAIRSREEHDHIRELIRKNPATCRHLKGGRIQASGVKDYNVSCHTFIDGSVRIRCHSCGRKWINTDSDWKEAVNMVAKSTNGPTSSEAPMLLVTFPSGQDRVYQNKEALKKDFPDYDGHIDN